MNDVIKPTDEQIMKLFDGQWHRLYAGIHYPNNATNSNGKLYANGSQHGYILMKNLIKRLAKQCGYHVKFISVRGSFGYSIEFAACK